MSKIFLTGATGLVGSHIADYFSAKGEQLICLVRKNSDLSFLKTLNLEIIEGDIFDIELLIEKTKDIDCVIHTAGKVSDWGQKDDFYKTNVDGTLNVLKACNKNNIRNIIITGSISSYGEENSEIIKDENSPYKSHYNYFLDSIFPCGMNFYRDSKAEMTRQAIEFAEKNKLNLTIIEPAWIFGEREKYSGFYEYLKSVKGMTFMPGSKKNHFPVIYAKDLAKAYYKAFQKSLQGVNRIIVGNHEVLKMDNVYELFCKSSGLKKPSNISKYIIYPIAFVLELIATIFKTKNPPLLTRGRVNMFYDNIQYSTKKSQNLLNLNDLTPLEEAIQNTCNWYKENNWL